MAQNKTLSLKVGNVFGLIVTTVIIFLFVFDTATYIPPGYVGVFINKISGKIDTDPVHSGYALKLPFFQQIIQYPYFMQTVILTQGVNGSSTMNEAINVNSIEGQPVSCDVSLSFTLDPKKVPFLYTSFRQSIDHISHGYIKQTIRQAMQEVMGKMAVTDFLGKGKADAVNKIQELLGLRLKQYGFDIKQFTINETRAPVLVIEAISQKNVMEQDALKAENELLKIKYEAQQKVELSKGQSQAILLEAQSQAKANNILTQSINNTLVEYKAIDKWDGNMPTVSTQGGGAVPLININLTQKNIKNKSTNQNTGNTNDQNQ